MATPLLRTKLNSNSVELSRQALDWLPEDDRFLRSIAAWLLSISHLANGDRQAASQALDEIAQISQKTGNVMIAVMVVCQSAELCMRRGQLHEAEVIYQQALELVADRPGRPLPIAGQALIGLGELSREWNDLEAATHFFVDEGEPTGRPESPTREEMRLEKMSSEKFVYKSRPITTLIGHNLATGEWNDSLTGDYLWSNVNFSEAVPDVMTPLSYSINMIFHTERLPSSPTWAHRYPMRPLSPASWGFLPSSAVGTPRCACAPATGCALMGDKGLWKCWTPYGRLDNDSELVYNIDVLKSVY